MAYKSRKGGDRDRNWEVAERDNLKMSRELARKNNLEEIYFNLHSKVVSFAPIDYQRVWGERGRMNVYYSTGTVATCLYHHQQGRTQLFRRIVSSSTLGKLMGNPRSHTGYGYHRKIVQIPNDRDPSSETVERDEHDRLWHEQCEEEYSSASEGDQEEDVRRFDYQPRHGPNSSRDRSRDRSRQRDRHHDQSRDRRDSNVTRGADGRGRWRSDDAARGR